MDVGTAKELLRDNGIAIIEEKKIGNGIQIRLDGAVVNVFDNGNWNVQGKNPELKKLVEEILARAEPTSKSPASDKIFVVYGHDEDAKRDTEILLRRWGLEPLFLDQLPSNGDTIIESLERYIGQAQYAVVLATPDDMGHQVGCPNKKSFRVRQNVVLELGMVLARLGRKQVAILIKKSNEMENPSDIDGLIYIPFKDKIEEAKVQLAQKLDAAGYNIPLSQL